MTDAPDFLAEDYRFTAELFRAHSTLDDPALFRAGCSNKLNIILAALDEAAEIAELVEALVSSDEAAVPPKSEAEP
jgi:hypothetical protein